MTASEIVINITMIIVGIGLFIAICLLISTQDDQGFDMKFNAVESDDIPPPSLAEILHNMIGHPLMALCNLLHLYRLGTWIHDKLFKF